MQTLFLWHHTGPPISFIGIKKLTSSSFGWLGSWTLVPLWNFRPASASAEVQLDHVNENTCVFLNHISILLPWWYVRSTLLWWSCLISSKSPAARWPPRGCIWSWTCQTDEMFVFPRRTIRERGWILWTDDRILIPTKWLYWLFSDYTLTGLCMEVVV